MCVIYNVCTRGALDGSIYVLISIYLSNNRGGGGALSFMNVVAQCEVKMWLRKSPGCRCCKNGSGGRLPEPENQSVTVQIQLDGVHHEVYAS